MCSQIADRSAEVTAAPRMPEWVAKEIRKFHRIPKREQVDVLRSACTIFKRVPEEHQETATATFVSLFPRISSNVERCQGLDSASKIERYLGHELQVLNCTSAVYGFSPNTGESWGVAALKRVGDPTLPLFKRAYALCLLASNPKHRVMYIEALKVKSDFVTAFNDLGIKERATSRLMLEETLGKYLTAVVMSSQVQITPAIGKIKELRGKSAFLRDYGRHFISSSDLQMAQSKIKTEMDSLIPNTDELFSSSWTRFKTKCGLDEQPAEIQNRAMGYFINVWNLCQVMESLYTRQHDEHEVPLANYQSFLRANGPYVTHTHTDESNLWSQLPTSWLDSFAATAQEPRVYPSGGSHSAFYVSRTNGNLKLRKRNHPKATRADATLAAVKTMFKNEGNFIDRVLAEKRGPNLLVGILHARYNAVIQDITRMKVAVDGVPPSN